MELRLCTGVRSVGRHPLGGRMTSSELHGTIGPKRHMTVYLELELRKTCVQQRKSICCLDDDDNHDAYIVADANIKFI
ncbi:jg27538 [Pararge aegeria aegeria]|uniref:Jg27538 protein n=1 Tax=Pararge aegeria aegeria TaxID=348720 RepID=A0A8S4SJK1_9NEOP|nr:jg27538 [Pararge aegeria aegeria]